MTAGGTTVGDLDPISGPGTAEIQIETYPDGDDLERHDGSLGDELVRVNVIPSKSWTVGRAKKRTKSTLTGRAA